MFNQSPEERLTQWSTFRKDLNSLSDPLSATAQLWADAPLIIHNHKIDPYNYRSWPTPWEILVENKYDDFTLALMMAYTLKLTQKFNKSTIEVKTMVDSTKTKLYNLVCVDDQFILNYDRYAPTEVAAIDQELYLENIIEVKFPR